MFITFIKYNKSFKFAKESQRKFSLLKSMIDTRLEEKLASNKLFFTDSRLNFA